jgi:hypothetical protein
MPMKIDKMMRDMVARMPKALSEASDVTDERVALCLASALAHRTLRLAKSASNQSNTNKHIEEFTLLFTLVQRLSPATFAEMYVQTCYLIGQSQPDQQAYFEH